MPDYSATRAFYTTPEASFFQKLASWLFTHDHKRIGLLYLYTIMVFFIVGMTLGGLIRFELIAPGSNFMDAQTYNVLFTLHGVIMIFFVVIPSIPATFGNIFLPIQLGADDVSFPPYQFTFLVALHCRSHFDHLLAFFRWWTTGYRMDILRSI